MNVGESKVLLDISVVTNVLKTEMGEKVNGELEKVHPHKALLKQYFSCFGKLQTLYGL